MQSGGNASLVIIQSGGNACLKPFKIQMQPMNRNGLQPIS